MKKRVLLIEDEKTLRVSLTDRLIDEDYSVETALDGVTGYERARDEPFDLIILDIKLPRKNGFDLCRELRQQGINTPILMLTARGQVADRVLGLKLGADDYLVKPFEPAELLARMEALLRRAPTAATPHPDVYQFGAIRVNFRFAEVERDGKQIALLPLEYKLLRYFIEHRGMPVSRPRILSEVWGFDVAPATRSIDVYVAGLRQKIEPDPRHPKYILTIHGFGYKFVG